MGGRSNQVVNGRVFDQACTVIAQKNNPQDVVFKNDADWELLEAWVGVHDERHEGLIRFQVKGDGRELYSSNWMSWRDAAINIRVPIKNYRGISLVTIGNSQLYPRVTSIWAEPVFVKFVRPAQPPPAYTPTPVQAAPISDQVVVQQYRNGQIAVEVNGRQVNFGYVRPQVRSGRLLVPMRRIFEAMGATVNFDSGRGIILAARDRREVQMKIGSAEAFIDGRSIRLEVPAQTTFGTTLVPLRFVAEAFDTNVNFWRE